MADGGPEPRGVVVRRFGLSCPTAALSLGFLLAIWSSCGSPRADTSDPAPEAGGGPVSTWSTPVPGRGVQAMSGGVANGALGDRSPEGRADTIVFAAGEYGGTGSVFLHHGLLQAGPTTRIAVSDGAGGESMYDATAVQDSVSYDVHIVSATNPGQQIHYWRYRPTRHPGPGKERGTITGWNRLAHVVLPTSFATAVAPSMIEVTDGGGRKRLMVLGQSGEPGGPADLVAFTTATRAGDHAVTPGQASDFTGLQGEHVATRIATHRGHDFWSTTVFLEQHPVSRTVECFAMSGLHGDEGEHSRTPLVVSPAHPTHWVAAPTERYSKEGEAWRGTAGGFAAVGPDDSVWWTWSGQGARQRFSRVDGRGVVTHDVIPSPGDTALTAGAGQFPFMNHLAISSGGAVASLVTSVIPPYRVVLRVYQGGGWHESVVTTLPQYNIQGCGFRGTTTVNGAQWMALYVAQAEGEGVLAAATFPR